MPAAAGDAFGLGASESGSYRRRVDREGARPAGVPALSDCGGARAQTCAGGDPRCFALRARIAGPRRRGGGRSGAGARVVWRSPGDDARLDGILARAPTAARALLCAALVVVGAADAAGFGAARSRSSQPSPRPNDNDRARRMVVVGVRIACASYWPCVAFVSPVVVLLALSNLACSKDTSVPGSAVCTWIASDVRAGQPAHQGGSR
jgi:hypothetical protein